MPDLSQNLVHLRWLLKLVDFRAAGELSWWSVVLATLYQEMCGATPPNKAKIGASYVGIPTTLEDICLLLDQRSEAHVFFLEYIEIWKNQYDHIPTHQSIIVPELACAPDYMPRFRIHGKPYLLSQEQMRRQIRVERERRGRLNPRRKDNGTCPSTAPTQSPGPTPQE
ncbi:hypothetical protein CXB51_008027 [Gossypium anomalum]|uniref:Aminotransferase-like plant mobile domain-containing protein n=1 Tax=Gossypium anomalum TaxID=47600 RepID=A0A8J5Z8N2_9ROSI|nr:hypothetical protein CXB51_008027 [Gossypium anomalum]